MTTTAYWRPSSIAQALDLLERPGAVVLGGGTRLNGRQTAHPVEVVDLQALDLRGFEQGAGDELTVGAMTTLQVLADAPEVPEVVREAARREAPSTLRAQGTVGGCIATGHPESELLAALLVHEAVAHVTMRAATETVPLDELLADLPVAGRVVTAVTLRTTGPAAAFRTARTPADRAIVAAYARATRAGARVALTGVAPTPVLVRPGDVLHPPADFRGSTDYRRALAEVLLNRALGAIA